MNNVNVTGRLTKAPGRPTVTESRRQVLDLRLALNHHRRETLFVNVTCWGAVTNNPRSHRMGNSSSDVMSLA